MNNSLRYILECGYTNHKNEILNCGTLKKAHVYCKIHNISGIIAGPAIESLIKEKYKMTKNSNRECIGDLSKNGTNYEVKISNGGKFHNKFNFVQIRMNHTCAYILSAYHLTVYNVDRNGDLYIFCLSKEEMKNLILKYGTYAHGTTTKNGKITEESLNFYRNDKEYALRPKFGDKCWEEMLKFRIYLKE